MKKISIGISLLAAAFLQGCGTTDDYYAPAYDKDYQQYKMEKEMEHEIEKEYSKEELKEIERGLKRKY